MPYAAIGLDTPDLAILRHFLLAITKNCHHLYYRTLIKSKLGIIPSTKLNLPIIYISLLSHPMKGTAIGFGEFSLVFSE